MKICAIPSLFVFFKNSIIFHWISSPYEETSRPAPPPAAGRVALPEVHLHMVELGRVPVECAGCS